MWFFNIIHFILIATPVLSDSDELSSSDNEDSSLSCSTEEVERPKKKVKLSSTPKDTRNDSSESDKSRRIRKSRDLFRFVSFFFISDDVLLKKMDQISDEIVKKMELLTKKIEEVTISIKTMSETQLWMEKQLVALRKNLIRTESAVQLNVKYDFPIDDEENLKKFVDDLKDKDYLDLMVT